MRSGGACEQPDHSLHNTFCHQILSFCIIEPMLHRTIKIEHRRTSMLLNRRSYMHASGSNYEARWARCVGDTGR